MTLFTRHPQNPILSPTEGNWEDGAVFNPGATFFENKFYLLYRAIGEYDRYVSQVGKATSSDGVNFIRSSSPVIFPQKDYEHFGIEDLRINPLEGVFYLTHTVLGSPAPKGGEPHQVGLIKTTNFQEFERLGVITPREFCSRNAVLFPEKINGLYVMLHRPLYLSQEKHPEDKKLPKEPAIWISYSENLLEWKNNQVLMEAEFWWENFKIGDGPPPIKTPKGWLVIYHGSQKIDKENYVYRAGAALLDLNNPKRVLSRLPEPILEPQTNYEIKGDVPNVVFPTGLVLKDGLLYLYYGAADRTCCLATASLKEVLEALEK